MNEIKITMDLDFAEDLLEDMNMVMVSDVDRKGSHK